ncbi:MAG: iron ABC transporter permease, partial [Lentisphaeria bacterium]|nr:ABC transporter permease subunit [Lentisphaeria bacterium]NQZ68648.1 iron ABC transporter permease [Lentisphaeria bacterium]
MKNRQISGNLLSLAFYVFFLLFLIFPLYSIIKEGLSIAYIKEVFGTPFYLSGMRNSLGIAIVSSLLTILIAFPLAFVSSRYDFPFKKMTQLLILLPLILPPFVGALGYEQFFGQTGVLNTLLINCGILAFDQPIDWLAKGRFWVVCMIEAFHLYPILYLNLLSSMQAINPAFDDAARSLGSSPFKRFKEITLPLMKGGFFSGLTIVFIWSFTELGTPLMIGYNTVIPVQIFNGITELGSNPLPYTLVLIMLLFVFILYLIGHGLFGKHYGADQKMTFSSTPQELSGAKKYIPLALFLVVTLIAVIPHISISLMSVSQNWYSTLLPSAYTSRFYEQSLSHSYVIPSIFNSLSFSISATLLCCIIGVTLAVVVERVKPAGYQLLDTLGMMPLAIPGLILAFGYLSVSTRYDFLKAFLDPFKNPTMLL